MLRLWLGWWWLVLRLWLGWWLWLVLRPWWWWAGVVVAAFWVERVASSAAISSRICAGGEPLHTEGGHRSTRGSDTVTSYTPPSSVKRLSGYRENTGAG